MITSRKDYYAWDNDNNDPASYDSISTEQIIQKNGKMSSRKIDSVRVFNTKVKDRKLHFKKVINPTYRFSFEIPKYWKVKFEKDYKEGICRSSTLHQEQIYSDCYNNSPFTVKVYQSPLDSVLKSEGYEKQKNGNYTYETRNGDVDEEMKGKDWYGHYHYNYGPGSCLSSGWAYSGNYTYLFFCKKRTTVLIYSESGFSNKVLARLKSSFRFY